jgi:hypothetical protein
MFAGFSIAALVADESIAKASLKPWLVWHGAQVVLFSNCSPLVAWNEFDHWPIAVVTVSELSWHTPHVALPSCPSIPSSPAGPWGPSLVQALTAISDTMTATDKIIVKKLNFFI